MAKIRTCSEALEALNRGLDPEICHSFRDVRRVALCAAWHKVKGEGGPLTPETFESRVQAGWDEVRKACERHGGIKPEVGFLGPGQVSRTLPPEAFAERVTNVREIKQGGERVGLLTETASGEVIACVHNRCEIAKRGEPAEHLATMLKIYGFDVED